jgi:hypothetical protein
MVIVKSKTINYWCGCSALYSTVSYLPSLCLRIASSSPLHSLFWLFSILTSFWIRRLCKARPKQRMGEGGGTRVLLTVDRPREWMNEFTRTAHYADKLLRTRYLHHRTVLFV